MSSRTKTGGGPNTLVLLAVALALAAGIAFLALHLTHPSSGPSGNQGATTCTLHPVQGLPTCPPTPAGMTPHALPTFAPGGATLGIPAAATP